MLYQELTTIVPFYLNHLNQNRFKENVQKACEPQNLISSKDKFLPFMIFVHCGKKPTKWFIKNTSDNIHIDISYSLDKIYGVKYADGKVYAFFNGGRLYAEIHTMLSNNIQEVNLVGNYYHEIHFGDIVYTSEVIHFLDKTEEEMENSLMSIKFRSNTNLNTLRYPPKFYQKLWLDTFSHSSRVIYEEEGDTDGENTFIPTFQKMDILYENNIVTNDFLKNAIHTLKFHDDILVQYRDERYGNINGVEVESENIESGALHNISLDFLTTLVTKSGCAEQIEFEDFFNLIQIEDIQLTIPTNTNSFRSLNYIGYDGNVSEVQVIRQPETTQIRFVNSNQLELNPQPYYIGVDSFMMKIKSDTGIWSEEFEVRINITESWELDDEQTEMKTNEQFTYTLNQHNQNIIEIIPVEIPTYGSTAFEQPNKVIYNSGNERGFFQIKYRAVNENNLISNIATLTISVV